jgi:hypothetical protein
MDDEMISLMKDTAHYISVYINVLDSDFKISSIRPSIYECLGLVIYKLPQCILSGGNVHVSDLSVPFSFEKEFIPSFRISYAHRSVAHTNKVLPEERDRQQLIYDVGIMKVCDKELD